MITVILSISSILLIIQLIYSILDYKKSVKQINIKSEFCKKMVSVKIDDLDLRFNYYKYIDENVDFSSSLDNIISKISNFDEINKIPKLKKMIRNKKLENLGI